MLAPVGMGGQGFGYGKRSVSKFKQKTGLDPMTMTKTRESTQKWDDWRRDQVTQVVRTVRRRVKSINPKITFSVAALCWPDRAYLSSYQDWGGWLEEGIIDAALIMNYSIDSKFVNRLSRQAIALKNNKDIYIGLGAYLLDKDLSNFQKQIEETLDLSPEGIVFFSYDSMLKRPEMFELANKQASSKSSRISKKVWKQEPKVVRTVR